MTRNYVASRRPIETPTAICGSEGRSLKLRWLAASCLSAHIRVEKAAQVFCLMSRSAVRVRSWLAIFVLHCRSASSRVGGIPPDIHDGGLTTTPNRQRCTVVRMCDAQSPQLCRFLCSLDDSGERVLLLKIHGVPGSESGTLEITSGPEHANRIFLVQTHTHTV